MYIHACDSLSDENTFLVFGMYEPSLQSFSGPSK